MTGHVRICEIFGPTIQGEGPLMVVPRFSFARRAATIVAGSWCDTLYAVLPDYRDEWTMLTPTDIVARVNELTGNTPVLVTLSGGNPALQPLDQVITIGRQQGHQRAIQC